MPPILIGFFILLGALAGPDLVRGLDPRPDRSSRSKFGKPAPQEYRTWTSTLPVTLPAKDGTCDVTFFAMATRGRRVRLLVDGVEQLVDWSWSFHHTLKTNEAKARSFEFRDPVSGSTLACQVQEVVCGSRVPGSESRNPTCAAVATPVNRNGGRPSLVGMVPGFRMYDSNLGGAEMDVEFVIRGQPKCHREQVPCDNEDDAWWCPRLDVYWPDETRTVRESDCAPFSEGSTAVQRWKFTRTFPAAEWNVKACVSKGGKVLACTTVVARVIGGSNG